MDFTPKTPKQFDEWVEKQIELQGKDTDLFTKCLEHHARLGKTNRFYMNKSFGLPVLQTADDLLQLSELTWEYKPSVIIETGIARGGSILFHASQLLILKSLGLIDLKPIVIGIDVLIHDYNRQGIESSPFADYIKLIQSSSVSSSIPSLLQKCSPNFQSQRKIIILDSNHEEEHVYKELMMYSQFCLPGDYIIVFDTLVEYLDSPSLTSYEDRPWSRGSNPLTAVEKFLTTNTEFSAIETIDNKLVCSGAINGWLRKN